MLTNWKKIDWLKNVSNRHEACIEELQKQNKFLTKENLKLNEQIGLIAKHLGIEFKMVERKDEYMKIRKVK